MPPYDASDGEHHGDARTGDETNRNRDVDDDMRDNDPLIWASSLGHESSNGGGMPISPRAGGHHHDRSTNTWGTRDRGWLGGYNDVVSRLPSFQIFLFAIISAATLAVLYGRAGESASARKDVLSAFIGSAAVETMLSLDNLVVFHQIFSTFKVPPSRRPGILVAGLPIMFVVRISLFMSFHGIYTYLRILFILIGLFIMYQGVCVLYFSDDDDDEDLSNNWIVSGVKKCIGSKLSTKYEGSAFYNWRADNGAFYFTPLVLVMLLTEASDLMFCIDGVSTIYVVGHTNLVSVICGDLCAVLLVRALYPQLQGTVEIFPDLNYAVAATLMAVGVDMLCSAVGKEFPVYVLIVFMVCVFICGIVSSLVRGLCGRTPDSTKRDVDSSTVPTSAMGERNV
jgi:predicted tellurium resistance membrane protein TerC